MNTVVNVSALPQSIGITLIYRDIAPGLFTHGQEHSHQKETLKEGESADVITCQRDNRRDKAQKVIHVSETKQSKARVARPRFD